MLRLYRSRGVSDEVHGIWEVFLSDALSLEFGFPSLLLEGVALFLGLEVWDLLTSR